MGNGWPIVSQACILLLNKRLIRQVFKVNNLTDKLLSPQELRLNISRSQVAVLEQLL